MGERWADIEDVFIGAMEATYDCDGVEGAMGVPPDEPAGETPNPMVGGGSASWGSVGETPVDNNEQDYIDNIYSFDYTIGSVAPFLGPVMNTLGYVVPFLGSVENVPNNKVYKLEDEANNDGAVNNYTDTVVDGDCTYTLNVYGSEGLIHSFGEDDESSSFGEGAGLSNFGKDVNYKELNYKEVL